jgi:ribose-phosphate pyrophosphokinase
MSQIFFALPGNELLASRLAALAHGAIGALETRQFPDGETYLRFIDEPRGRDVVFVCTLDRPDAKIVHLLFAAEAARELGAHRVGLVAPYLCYMRQDERFKSGEAVTSRSFARLMSRAFDWLVTVDPHLHRYHSLADIYAIPAKALHVGPAIAQWIRENVPHPFLIGPDSESRQWVALVAQNCGVQWTVAEKIRSGDRDVIEQPFAAPVPPGVTPVLLDDIISSGVTMLETLRLLKGSRAKSPIAIAIHGLCSADTAATLKSAGAKLVTTNSVPNPWAQIDIAPLIATGLAEFLAVSR